MTARQLIIEEAKIAVANKLSKFESTVPCPKKHTNVIRYTANGQCVECHREYYKKNSKQIKKYHKAWIKRNPEVARNISKKSHTKYYDTMQSLRTQIEELQERLKNGH